MESTCWVCLRKEKKKNPKEERSGVCGESMFVPILGSLCNFSNFMKSIFRVNNRSHFYTINGVEKSIETLIYGIL